MAETTTKTLTTLEKLENAKIKKTEGNELFKHQEYSKAIRLYHEAILFLRGLDSSKIDGIGAMASAGSSTPKIPQEVLDEIKLNLVACYSNLAACQLKLSNWTGAERNSSEALKQDPENAKALFRRGQANFEMGNLNKAENDFQAANKINPSDSGPVIWLKKIEEWNKELEAKQKKELRAFLKFEKAKMKSQRGVPWSNQDEWAKVFTFLFSSHTSDMQRGVNRVKAWSSRSKVPLAIESTATFIEIQLRDPHFCFNTLLSDHELRLLYSIAFIRFVNSMVDSYQIKVYAVSVAALANKIGLPGYFVDLRHQATHDELPSLDVLRSAGVRALQWLHDHYWLLQKREVDNTAIVVETKGSKNVEPVTKRGWEKLTKGKPCAVGAVDGQSFDDLDLGEIPMDLDYQGGLLVDFEAHNLGVGMLKIPLVKVDVEPRGGLEFEITGPPKDIEDQDNGVEFMEMEDGSESDELYNSEDEGESD
ncbi:Ribosomal biogenesis protein las1l [Nowakowskiella sp. JEL0078]|nr:Ribosomal biogenesis protein las1l [Nowakowskiella sp. JEL0078]